MRCFFLLHYEHENTQSNESSYDKLNESKLVKKCNKVKLVFKDAFVAPLE